MPEEHGIDEVFKLVGESRIVAGLNSIIVPVWRAEGQASHCPLHMTLVREGERHSRGRHEDGFEYVVHVVESAVVRVSCERAVTTSGNHEVG
ncbi:hypothetical protein ABZU45_20660 [Streptomyces avermitilis]|uniref:hypothetical protein n=1 Tax=Streptomyces avermitilis TaxID=33903 RepID=UPI0033A8EA2D